MANRSVVLSLVALLTAAPVAARAQEAASPLPGALAAATSIKHGAFVAQVLAANVELAAQRANVPIAEAQLAVARIFPDPTLTAGVASVDLSRNGSPTATTLGLGYTFELGGKRSARVAAARSEWAGAQADLDDYLRTLRGAATGGFIDGLYARLVLERKQQTLHNLEKLVAVNEQRLRAGDVGKVALTQSRVEAQRFHGEVIVAEADVEAQGLALALYTGGAPGGRRLAPQGDLRLAPRTFDVEALIAQARVSRPDLTSKRRAAESAAERVGLARANRWIDLTLNVSWQHTFPGAGMFAAPSFDALAATASVPIPLSKAYHGELDAALAREGQSRTTVQAASLRIEVEIRQAHARQRAAAARVALYTGGLLEGADQVLESTLYNYQKGGATLLEVLEAQRTQNDVYLAYYEALADSARTLVALELAAGIWDVEL
jgi:cobalt-zinc-cadmium efflux system outer membrane protein